MNTIPVQFTPREINDSKRRVEIISMAASRALGIHPVLDDPTAQKAADRENKILHDIYFDHLLRDFHKHKKMMMN